MSQELRVPKTSEEARADTHTYTPATWPDSHMNCKLTHGALPLKKLSRAGRVQSGDSHEGDMCGAAELNESHMCAVMTARLGLNPFSPLRPTT